MDKQIVAIGLFCKKCSVQADMHHVYLDKGQMYVQGPCQECGEDIRFSCDELLISLMTANPQRNGKVQ